MPAGRPASSLSRRFRGFLVALALVAGGGRSPAEDGGVPFVGFQVPGPAINIGPGGNVAEAWYGGDGGNVYPINETTLFCSFTDAYVGPTGLTRATIPPPLHNGNTIAIVNVDKRTRKVTKVQHYFRSFNLDDPREATPKPPAYHRSAFFPVVEPSKKADRRSNLEKQARIFLRKAVMPGDGNLYIFAHMASGAFTIENTLIIRVTNPEAPPPDWKYSYLNLGNFGPDGLTNVVTGRAAPYCFGYEAFALDGYLYTYGFYNKHYQTPKIDLNGSFSVYPLRIPLAILRSAPANTDVTASAEYLTDGPSGAWKKGLFGDDRRVVGDNDNFGLLSFSTRYNRTLRLWQTVFTHDKFLNIYGAHGDDPSGPDSQGHSKYNSAWIMTSPDPWGPWSKPVHVHTFAETLKGNPLSNKSTKPGSRLFCYGTKEFPAFEADDSQIVLGYTTISILRDENTNNQSLYTLEGCTVPNPLTTRGDARPLDTSTGK